MKIEKIINNNVISAFDESGLEVVVMGKGIGYKRKTGEPIDENKIEKIFRIKNAEVLNRFEQLLENLPLEHLQVSNEIISYAKKKLDMNLNQNVYITLTDHINFAIERLKNGNIFHNALLTEVKMFYPKEFQVGQYALELIEAKTKVSLPEDEAASIALHIVNAELNTKIRDVWSLTNFIQEVLEIIENELKPIMKVQDIQREYLIASIKFLGKRILIDGNKKEKSDSLLEFVRKEYPEEYKCAKKVVGYIERKYECEVSQEEIAYLVVNLKKITHDYTD